MSIQLIQLHFIATRADKRTNTEATSTTYNYSTPAISRRLAVTAAGTDVVNNDAMTSLRWTQWGHSNPSDDWKTHKLCNTSTTAYDFCTVNRKAPEKIFLSCPSTFFGSTSIISHFVERFRDGKYSLVHSLLFYSPATPRALRNRRVFLYNKGAYFRQSLQLALLSTIQPELGKPPLGGPICQF